MTIKINGENRSAYVTMGAMLMFHEQTGKEISEINGVSEMIVYCYCCAASCAEREGKKLDLTIQQFANRIDPVDFNAWCLRMQQGSEADADTEKKRE